VDSHLQKRTLKHEQIPVEVNDLRIASPCTAYWNTMAGDNRVRHCALCNLNVYNFSEMSAREIRDLVAQREGRLCGRMFRRADGTLLSRDCPRRLLAAAHRVSLWASAVLSTLMAVGCASQVQIEQGRIKSRGQASTRPTPTAGLIQIQSNTIETGISISVTGIEYLVVSQASVTATPLSGGKNVVTGTTDERGKLLLPLKASAYRVTVARAGFDPVTMAIDVAQGKLTPIEFKLGQPALMGDVMTADPGWRRTP
jgi:hypothetical protein